MKFFLAKICIFGVPLFFMLYSYIFVFEYLHYPKPIEKGVFNNNLFYIPKSQQFDFVFLGSSRAVPFDKWNNKDSITKYLNIKVINLSNQGGGLLNQKIYLSYFFSKNNKTNQIIYFIDPFVLNNSFFDYETMFNKEPFKFFFALEMIKCGANIKTVVNYITSKLSFNPFISRINDEVIQKNSVTEERIKDRIDYLYREKDMKYNQVQKKKILKIINIAETNNSKIIFILLPTLLGKERAHPDMIEFLNDIKKNKSYEYFDFSNKMQDESYFRDVDHLNSYGISYFFKTYLQDVIISHKSSTRENDKQ